MNDDGMEAFLFLAWLGFPACVSAGGEIWNLKGGPENPPRCEEIDYSSPQKVESFSLRRVPGGSMRGEDTVTIRRMR